MSLKKCCCCFDLRKGCAIFAIIGIIVNCGFFGTGKSLYLETNGSFDSSVYVMVLGSIVGILGNLCFLYGAISSNKTAVSLYLLVEGLRMGLFVAFAILNFIVIHNLECVTILEKNIPYIDGLYMQPQTQCSLIFANAFFALISVVFWIYVWLCAFSLQKN